MKYSFFTILLSFLIISCTNNPGAGSGQNQHNYQDAVVQDASILADVTNLDSLEVLETPNLVIRNEGTKEGLKQISYTIRKETIDSLNKVVEIYDSTLYNGLAISYFASLAENLNGKAFFAENEEVLIESIMDIFTTRVDSETDVVFLIDKTGSMDDDIEKVKSSISYLMDYLQKYKNVRLGIAAYGDENWHYDLWYNSLDLTSDIDVVRDFLAEFYTIGNPDIAESVNDGIVRTVENMSWRKGSNRIMLVIGDAPSLEPPYSKYSTSDVLRICANKNVRSNIYPIILGVDPLNRVESFVKRDFVKVYPNPVRENLNAQFDFEGTFNYVLYNVNGKIIDSGVLRGSTGSIDCNRFDNGTYLIRIEDTNSDRFFTSKIIVSH
jgi:hypothetical protein